ncbi:CAP domain-containing protein [Lactobacillus sp. R2/2]|nr:CAP domain-containing protein [Lactobacillus sp. R2/2]
MPFEKRPKVINKSVWQLARNISSKANLNFNTSDQTAGDVITDLLTDQYNLTGADTGHRAWLLSTRLTSTGAGAAYGKNGYRYSVQKVLILMTFFVLPAKKW